MGLRPHAESLWRSLLLPSGFVALGTAPFIELLLYEARANRRCCISSSPQSVTTSPDPLTFMLRGIPYYVSFLLAASAWQAFWIGVTAIGLAMLLIIRLLWYSWSCYVDEINYNDSE